MNIVRSIYDAYGDGLIVNIETHLSNGLPNMQIIGVVGKSLEESKERIRSAFSNSGLELPRKKITSNISPSDIPKNGSHFDLGLAVSVLLESGQLKTADKDCIFIGELGLDGSIKSVRGILGKIQIAKTHGYHKFIIPYDNIKQATLIPKISVAGFNNLREMYKHLSTKDLNFLETGEGSAIKTNKNTNFQIDFSDVIGQSTAKRALEIAASGQHNVLLSGPPGVGKSMLAKALISIMPPLSREEIITITHIHSLVGTNSVDLITNRPLRSPHHSSSDVALIGGGQRPKPGEVSLSHTGILFLDELPEFRRSTLESLRQPLEDRQVTVSRAQDKATYPANFLLIATKNPCPCGYLGSSKACICSPIEIDRYQKKLSGPLLDRIDIHVNVDSVDHSSLLKDNHTNTEDSETIKKRVLTALKIQNNRFIDSGKRNGNMTNKEVKQQAKLDNEAKLLLDQAAEKLDLSARVYMKTVKVARTIADLENSDNIEIRHISEALRYRPLPTS